MEFGQYLYVVKKWLWLIALGTLLAAGVTYGVSSLLSPVYRASTTLLVRTARAEADDYSTVVVNQYLAATYRELMTKPPIIERAAQNLGLTPSIAQKLMTRIEVWVVPDTSVLQLAVQDDDPALAMKMANEIVSVFIESQRDLGQRRGQDIYVVEPAAYPTKPVAPRKLFNTLVAGVGGCIIAIGMAFLIEYLDDTFNTSQDVDRALSLPTLAAIPEPNHHRGQHHAPTTTTGPLTSVDEAYYALRAMIQFPTAVDQATPRTLLITSSSSRKDKTGVTASLGIALAQAGLKVLLVDVDVRHPHLHGVFGLDNNRGLSGLLTGDENIQAAVVQTAIPALSILPSGPLLSEPIMWLGSPQMLQLIHEFQTYADVVLFDAAPVLAAVDTTVLVPHIEGTILVVGSHSTPRQTVALAVERLTGARARLLGVVLTQVRDKRFRYRENGS